MLPDGVLSTESIIAPFLGARRFPTTLELDWEDGGIAIGDASDGSDYQVWKGQIVDEDVILTAENSEQATIYSGSDITEISFTFDQSMRPVLAFVQSGVAKMRWYDSVVGMQVITEFPGATSPRVTLDDKRSTQVQNNDVILAYIKSGNLYYRQQRDRFLDEYLLQAGVNTNLIKIGMNVNLRLQFMLEVGG